MMTVTTLAFQVCRIPRDGRGNWLHREMIRTAGSPPLASAVPLAASQPGGTPTVAILPLSGRRLLTPCLRRARARFCGLSTRRFFEVGSYSSLVRLPRLTNRRPRQCFAPDRPPRHSCECDTKGGRCGQLTDHSNQQVQAIAPSLDHSHRGAAAASMVRCSPGGPGHDLAAVTELPADK